MTGVIVFTIGIAIVFASIELMPSTRLLNGSVIEWKVIQEPYLPIFTVLGNRDGDTGFEVIAAAPIPRPDSTIMSYGGSALVRLWNQELFFQIRKYKSDPINAAKVIALLNVSFYDAVIISERLYHARSQPVNLRESHAHNGFDREVCNSAMALAGSAAAEAVLGTFFPLEQPRFSEIFNVVSLRYLDTNCATQIELLDYRKIGHDISGSLIKHMASKDALPVWSGTIPVSEHGWKPLRKLTSPFLPSAGRWRTWLLSDGSVFRPTAPPSVGSAAWRADADEVVGLGRNLTSSELSKVRFWADGMGTLTPSGHWLQFALGLSEKYSSNLPQTARMTAYLSMAMYDAFVACWDAKFTYWTARPEQLLPGFYPALPTPPFPAFPSGHATVSGAAAEVLGSIFPAEHQIVLFMAHEAAESRIYAGIHWRIDSTVGLLLGGKVGHQAVVSLASDG